MKTNSIVLSVLAAAAVFSACAKVEKNDPAPTAISFKAYNYKATKAAVESTTFPSTLDFKVAAAYTEGDYAKGSGTTYIDNEVCTYQSGQDIWTSANPAYWPLSGKLTFAAVSPASAGTWADKLASLTVANFTSTKQADLMFCAPSDCANKTNANDVDYVGTAGAESATNEYGVDLVFRHALSLVEVRAKAKAGLTNVSFEITDLKLTVKDNATLTVTDNYGSVPAYTTSWTTPTATYENDSFLKSGVTLASAATTTYVTVTADGKKVLVIPQTLVADSQALEVTYEMTYNGVSAGSTTKTVYLKTDALTAFEINKKYILNLELSADEIKYAPRIVDWEATVEEEYEVK